MRACGIFSAGRRNYVGCVVCDMYYSATVSTIVCIISKHLCIAGPVIRLARKNAKFIMKLSAAGHATLGKSVVSQGEATHLL